MKNGKILNTENLLYVNSENHNLYYHLDIDDNVEVVRDTLSKVLEELKEFGFLKVHRSFLVNEKKIAMVSTKTIFLVNGAEVPLSKTCKDQLQNSGHQLFQAI